MRFELSIAGQEKTPAAAIVRSLLVRRGRIAIRPYNAGAFGCLTPLNPPGGPGGSQNNYFVFALFVEGFFFFRAALVLASTANLPNSLTASSSSKSSEDKE
jgi:hypothetical protein